MSCNCSTPVAPVHYGSACTTTGSSSCPAPRRVATPPMTPVVYAWVGQLRQAYEGQALLRNGDELMVLDAPFSGQLFFDANTGKVTVSSFSANSVEDQFACSPTRGGFPVYGLGPGCREPSSNPDRQLAVVRPALSNQGFLYAHNHEAPAGPGLKAEIIPREINPAVLPDIPPEGLKYLSFRRVPATGDCVPPTMEWYESSGLQPVAEEDLTTTTVTYSELQDVTKAFNFLVTRFENNQWVSYRLTNESFKELIKQSSTSGITFLANPHSVLLQYRSNGSNVGAGAGIHPPIPDPQPLPMVPMSTQVYLPGIIGYTDQMTWVMLDLRMSVGISGGSIYAALVVNGREYVRTGASSTSDSDYNQVMVPIPSNKYLAVSFVLGTSGNLNNMSMLVMADIVAFGK
jgi:hypothetical protein